MRARRGNRGGRHDPHPRVSIRRHRSTPWGQPPPKIARNRGATARGRSALDRAKTTNNCVVIVPRTGGKSSLSRENAAWRRYEFELEEPEPDDPELDEPDDFAELDPELPDPEPLEPELDEPLPPEAAARESLR